MASLLKRGEIWTARIQVAGKARWRSLRTSDRTVAERKAREIEGAMKGQQWLRQQLDDLLARTEREVRPDEVPLLLASFGLAMARLLALVPADRRDALALSLSRSLVEQQGRKLAVATGWDSWLASANRGSPKASTVACYRSIWTRFAAWADARGVVWMHELDEAGALAYADALWGRKVSARSYNLHCQFLRSSWNNLRVAAGLTAPNPWLAVKSKAAPPDTGRRALTPDELRAVIGTAVGSLRLLMMAGMLTGARLGDIVNIRWADLDLEAGEWNFCPQKTSRTGRRLKLPLLDPLLGELRAAKAVTLGAHVFPVELELWQRDCLTQRISALFESCGIATHGAAGEGGQRLKVRVLVGFHSLRHSAATVAAKSGASLGLVQAVLGHATAGMTSRYTHGDEESARRVLAPLAEILSLPATAAKEVAA